MNAATLDRVFQARRFLYLLRYELYAGYRALVLILSVTLGVSFTAVFLAASSGTSGDFIGPLFSWLVLFAGGIVFSSRAFRDAHRPGDDLRYLTLPCSHFEKTLAKFALTAVGYPLLAAAASFLMTALSAPLTLLVFGRSLGLFNPFAAGVFEAAGVYLIVQSLFVFGSLYFRRMALAKTIIAVFVLAFAFGVFAALIFAAVNIDLIVKGAWALAGSSGRSFDPGCWNAPWMNAAGVVFRVLFAPFFWTATYVRLREQEVRSV